MAGGRQVGRWATQAAWGVAAWTVLAGQAAPTRAVALAPQTDPLSTPNQKKRPSQQPVDWERYEGRPVREVLLQRPERRGPDGQPIPPRPLDDRTLQLARNQIRLVEGVAFTRDQAEADLRNLNRLGRFGTAQTSVQQLADGSVRVIYTLEPQPIVLAVQTVGNRKFTDDQLLDEIGLIEGSPVDRFSLDRIARRLEDKYRASGYYLVKVDWDEEALVESGIVLFRIQEGNIVRIGQIRFEGNASIPAGELRSQIKSEETSLLLRGYVNDDTLDADVQAIVQRYQARGFLDARADRIVRPSPNGREVIVTFVIEEGSQFTLRNVQAYYPERVRARFPTQAEAQAALQQGEEYVGIPSPDGFSYEVFRPEPFSTAQVEGLMNLKRGQAYGTRDADLSVDDVATALHALGYSDVNAPGRAAHVRRIERRALDGPFVDVIMEIVPGETWRTGTVEIQGNEITQDRVVRRQLSVRPDRPLDTSELNESRQRLTATNLFFRDPQSGQSSVRTTIQPPSADDPFYRDVLIEVEETNTGRFNIGAAVDSDAGLTGRITVEQRNFDVFDTPQSWGDLFSGEAFRGAGQTARLELLPGTRYQTYSLSLTEPALWETDYSGTGSVYYRTRNFSQYDERRYGTRWTLGRRFGTRWVGNAWTRIENVELSDLNDDSPTDFYDVADPAWLMGFGASLTRTDVDDRTRPTRGSRVELSLEQVAGDYNFTRFTAEHFLFFTLREDLLGRRTVLSMRTALGVSPQGQDETPTYERFYLGGRSFRGFDFRGISPRGVRNDNAEPSDEAVGGTWSFFWGLELEQPIYETLLSGVVFLDTGTVEEDIGFDQYRVSVGVGLRVSVPQLSQVPIAFDFGVPLLKQDDDETSLFSFSIDVPFR